MTVEVAARREDRMREHAQESVRGKRQAGTCGAGFRPVDGFVVGGDAAWDSGQNLWLLLSRPGERLIDFFIEDDETSASRDPFPCACAGVAPDGTVLIGAVDWEMDRFLSEMLDERDASNR